jgi:hypothetical protein
MNVKHRQLLRGVEGSGTNGYVGHTFVIVVAFAEHVAFPTIFSADLAAILEIQVTELALAEVAGETSALTIGISALIETNLALIGDAPAAPTDAIAIGIVTRVGRRRIGDLGVRTERIGVPAFLFAADGRTFTFSIGFARAEFARTTGASASVVATHLSVALRDTGTGSIKARKTVGTRAAGATAPVVTAFNTRAVRSAGIFTGTSNTFLVVVTGAQASTAVVSTGGSVAGGGTRGVLI